MSAQKVTTVSFAGATDEEIIRDAIEILRRQDPAQLSPTLRALMKSRKPDIVVAGKFLWAYLTQNPIS